MLNNMLLGWGLLLVTFSHLTSSASPGVKVRLTNNGIEYGRQLGMAAIQKKLQSITIPDISGRERVSIVGKVRYSLSNIRTVAVGLPSSSVDLVPGTGVKLSISNAFISMKGNWRVKFRRILRDSGSFDLSVNGLSVSTVLAVQSDATGRPQVSNVQCTATVGSVNVKFHGGASWLYNLFRKFINKALRNTLQKKICPLVVDAVSDLNPQLRTLNVLARVDKAAEIDYSMVGAPTITNSLNLGLKGEFYNIGKHRETPFPTTVFSLPPENNKMLYLGLSAFTANSAAFVYNTAGVLSVYITDDMIPSFSPIRLNTRTFGVFIPEIAKAFPGLMMKLLIKTVKNPVVTLEPKNVTIQATGTVTAYAIQPNGTLSPLFVLNLDTSVSARVFVSGTRLNGNVTLNKIDLTLETSYVGDFRVRSLDNILSAVLNLVVIPLVNVRLGIGYPLPTLGKVKLVNPELQVLKDFLLIGTDVQFTA
ncbi:bactericidal permeability-increasing protein-like isoform X1 [Syngnathus acus]|uniref:bactericidal permeability-increasing protein-like isoform X1 n=2 Tax=Syngnathus acus TaxID=161584 RepID=UPI00188614B2|nr:bactericidal permeability-increasing protein-like isoform X1 [Syngnathus acus]